MYFCTANNFLEKHCGLFIRWHVFFVKNRLRSVLVRASRLTDGGFSVTYSQQDTFASKLKLNEIGKYMYVSASGKLRPCPAVKQTGSSLFVRNFDLEIATILYRGIKANCCGRFCVVSRLFWRN